MSKKKYSNIIKKDIDESTLKTCQICDEVFNTTCGVSGHLRTQHKLNFEDYIEKYFYEGQRPRCPICNEVTRYLRGQYGYSKYCKDHVKEAKSEWAKLNGYGAKVDAGWKKGFTKETHVGILAQSIKVSGKNNPHFTSEDDYYRDVWNAEEKHNFKFLSSYEEFKGHFYPHEAECIACGFKTTTYLNTIKYGSVRCPQCHPSSKEQTDLKNFVISLLDVDVQVIENDRKLIGPKELDIIIPEYKFAIEYNGLYSHSEKPNIKQPQANKFYHINKTKACWNIDYNLFHVFSDEWFNKQEIVKSMIRNRLGVVKERIYARKCEVRTISLSDARQFLEQCHIDGYATSAHKLGLFYQNELVSVLTLRTARYHSKNTMEIIRFANKLNCVVTGGFSKLFKKAKEIAIREGKTEFMTYADLRFGKGNVYLKNGFKFVGETVPAYWYTDHRQRLPRQKFMATPEMSEKQMAVNSKVYKVYGCGSNKFMLQLSKETK